VEGKGLVVTRKTEKKKLTETDATIDCCCQDMPSRTCHDLAIVECGKFASVLQAKPA